MRYEFSEGCPADIMLVGNAQCVPPAIGLTSSSQQQAGAAWIVKSFAVSQLARLSIEVTLSSSPGSSGSGDGFAIVLQADPRGPDALGVAGRYLGYGGTTGSTPGPITPSIALELDTARDGPSCPAPHAGFDVDGNVPASGPPCGVVISTVNPTSGAPFTVWLDHEGGMLSAYVAADPMARPTTPLVTAAHDLGRLGSNIYLGVTAATGQDNGPQRIHELRVSLDP